MPRRRRRPAAKHTAFLKRVTPVIYERVLEMQGGVCAICKRPPSERRKLDRDHDHRGMFLRGLLCPRCNRAIPTWMDSTWLRSAADYLDHGDRNLVPDDSGEKTAPHKRSRKGSAQ